MKSIKIRLITYISLLVIISLSALGLLGIYQAKNAIEAEAISGLQRLSLEASHSTDIAIQSHLDTIKSIASSNEIQSMDWIEQKKYLQQQTGHTDFLSFAVVNLKGDATFNDGKTANIADRAYFKSALSGETLISDMVISKLTSKPELVYATPIHKGSQIVGVLIARRDGFALSDITDQLGYGKSGYAYMINENGDVIAHKDRTRVEKMQNTILESETNKELKNVAILMKAILKTKNGFKKYSFNGKHLIASFTPVKNTPWILVITADES